MATATLQEKKAERREAIETNRELGIVPYENGERQSDAVYEVIEGYKHLPGSKRYPAQKLGPGQRFHPTEKQVADGSLEGKAREIGRTEYRGLRATPTRSTGADIGIRALPMAPSTLDLALRADLTEADFAGVEPGFEGRYTRSQVERIIEAGQDGETDGAEAP